MQFSGPLFTHIFGERRQNLALEQSINFSQRVGEILVQCKSANLLTLDLHFCDIGGCLRFLLFYDGSSCRGFCLRPMPLAPAARSATATMTMR